MLFVVAFFFISSLVLGYCLLKKTTATEKLAHVNASLKQRNDQLLENQALLSLAEQISHIGTWEINVDTGQVRWSDELFRIYGYPDNNFIPTKEINEAIIAAEYRDKFNKEVRRAINSRTSFIIEHQIVQPSGVYKYVLSQGYFIEQDNRLVGTVQDITQLKEAVLKLKINESLLREAEAVSHSGSWEWRVETSSVLWSDEMYRIHGFLPHSVFISLAFYRQLIHRDDLLRVISTFKNAYSNKSAIKINYRIVSAMGDVKHVLSTAEYKRIGLNNQFAYIGNTQDVTELREAQVQLEEKMIELRRSNQDLEQFAYVASHDLQEPLRKIQAFGARIKEGSLGKLDELSGNYLDRMCNAADRMRKLIDDLLAFSKATKEDKLFVHIKIVEVIHSCVRDLDYIIDLKRAVINIDSDEMVIVGVEPQLMQLFINLIGNALKFNKEGTPIITIDIQMQDGRELPFEEGISGQKYCLVKITDNGIGFSNSDSLKMFDIFQRLNSRNEYEGTGIGLALCKKIVGNHSGFIMANGIEGTGATFTVALPEKQMIKRITNETNKSAIN